MFSLTRSEMEIMRLLWQEKRPLSRTDIIERSEANRTWKASSIHILLNSMLEKGAIQIGGFVKTGSHYGRTYAPAISEEAYALMQIKEIPAWQTDRVAALKKLVSALVDDADVDEQTLKELVQMLRGRKG